MMRNGTRARTLFVTFRCYPLVGGVETQSEYLARALTKMGEPVEILSTAVRGSPGREERSGVVIYRSLRSVPLKGLWGAGHFLGTLFFLLRHGRRYRLVFCYQFQSFYNPAAVLWGIVFRRPVVMVGGCGGEFGDFHVLRRMISGRLLRAVLKKASAYVALSREMKEEMIQEGLEGEKIVILPNGVDTEFFAPPPGGSSRRDLVFAGRLAAQKGLRYMLQAMTVLKTSHPDLRLRILGAGPEMDRLKKQVAELGLDESVEFEGAAGADRVREAFASSAVVVQPSLEEGLSCSLLEAMATEAAVVTTDIAANRAVLDDGAQGLLVAPKDPEALAGAVARLLDDRDLARRLGRAARRRVEESYSIGAVAQRYGGLFSELSGLGGRA